MNEILKKYEQQVNDVVEVCHRDGELGYGPNVSGNVSYRVDEDFIIVTPTNVPKRIMTPDFLCAVHLNGEPIYLPEGKKPTGELFMHLHVMRKRPDIKAVMHAHPPICIGLSASRNGKKAMLLPLIPEAMMQLGPIVTVPYSNPNMESLGYALDASINDTNAFILENHGVLACSPNNVLEVIESIQIMESMAESVLTAMQMGGKIKALSEKDLEGIDTVIHELGWKLPGGPGRYRNITEIFSQK